VNGLSDSIAWPSRDPQWVSKVLLTGLILLIPIVGQMVVLGWMLTAVDNLRAGRQELPPAGFSYIGRGVPLFVVYLVYGLAIAVVFAALLAAGILISVAARDSAGGPLGAFFILLSYGLVLLASLGLYVLSPPIIVATERGGIGGGLNLPLVIRMVNGDFNAALYAGLFSLVAYLIGSIGAIACGIGQIFTLPYGYAVLAGVVHHYERTAGPRATPAA
jgi:hypothetical protein